MSQGAQKRAGSSASGGAADRRGLETELHEAGRLLAAGDAPAAAERLRGIAARGVLPPGREADARYLLGRALGVCGDRAGMTDEWGLVLRLDAAAASPQPFMPAGVRPEPLPPYLVIAFRIPASIFSAASDCMFAVQCE